jgi:hypothetical protein
MAGKNKREGAIEGKKSYLVLILQQYRQFID